MASENEVQVETRSLSDVARDWEGQVVNGEFTLRQLIGTTDHGAVFLTEYDDGESQPAAIKLIPEDTRKPQSQFVRWELATGLSHPNLLRIFQIGRCEIAGIRLLYAVMEYAEENLSHVLPERALTPEETRTMLVPLVDALIHIHEHGFVHSRIQPSNIMAIGDQLKLSSDGIHRMGEIILEASPYLAPEASDSGLAAASDLWSLGMALHEILTQHIPVREPNQEAEPLVPTTLPGPFFDIVRNCLRTDPRRRWTASDIALGLKASAPPRENVQDVKPHQPQRSVPQKRSHLLPVIVIASILFAGAGVGTVAVKHLQLARQAASTVNTNSVPEQQTRPLGPGVSASPPGKAPGIVRTSASESQDLAQGLKENTQAGVLHEVLPEVPEKARETIHGTLRLRVRVSVDAAGHVTDATLDDAGPSEYFANLALHAAQQWQFIPAPRSESFNSEDNNEREWLLNFAFSTTETKTDARQEAVR